MELIAPNDSTALWLADMENVREAFLWAREHDLELAVQLSARAAAVIPFSVWRLEVTDWVVSQQAAMEGAAGQSLPQSVQADRTIAGRSLQPTHRSAQ